MKRFLLDTSVLSLMAPGRVGVSPRSADWLRARGEQLFISTVTLAEIEQGVCKLRRSGADQRASALEAWLAELVETGAHRILPFDIEAARTAGRISDAAIAQGRYPGCADVAIAAIASLHGMVLLTTNGRHFVPLGIDHLDPLVELPR